MMVGKFEKQTKDLIDNLKATCASYGLGNDGNEFKIITQVFLYKFLNDKFGYELKKANPKFASATNWDAEISKLTESEYTKIVKLLSPGTAKLKMEHLIGSLYNQQNLPNFSKIFDSTLVDISQVNSAIFSVNTSSNSKIVLFEELSLYVSDPAKRDDFCKAIINQLVNFSFESIFDQKFDFFSTIFEYLIKDYNKDGGGKYAEYYTPHAVSKIMAKILVNSGDKNVTVYDPSAGSGTLLMNVAHEIGEKNCTIYSQDISQKSSGMLRLNLILNDLVHSIPNVIQGNTLTSPYFKDGSDLKQFDYIVSNPPFKLDFSDFHSSLDIKENSRRFFAGIPTIPNKKKDSMAIYLLFLQHIISSLSPNGKAAIVVPTSFLTAEAGIPQKIRQDMIDKKILAGLVAMPSNIFATTGTNVSVLFIDKSKEQNEIVLMDAKDLGTIVKEGRSQKTLLSEEDENYIIETFNSKENIEHFSHVVDIDRIIEKNYSLGPSQYAASWDPESISRKVFREFNDKGFADSIDKLSQTKQLRESQELAVKESLKILGFDSHNELGLSHSYVELGQLLFDLFINPQVSDVLSKNPRIKAGVGKQIEKLISINRIETRLGSIPDGWSVKNLTEVGSFLNGLAAQNFPVAEGETGLPVLKIAQLHDRTTYGADLCSANVDPKFLISDGDLIFSWSASLEIDYWTGGRAVLNQHLFKVEGIGVPNWFVYFAVRKYLPWFRMIAASKATTMGHIQRSHLEEALIFVPDSEYIKFVDKLISPFVNGHISLLTEATGLSNVRNNLE